VAASSSNRWGRGRRRHCYRPHVSQVPGFHQAPGLVPAQRPCEAGSGVETLTARDAGPPPVPRLPRSQVNIASANDQRTILDGQPRSVRGAPDLSAVRSRRHSYRSQTENAGTIRAVPSACPSDRQLTASRGLRQCSRLARSSDLTQGIRHIKLVPKLTVRVRFPSPAPLRKALRYLRIGRDSPVLSALISCTRAITACH
jgi:hypothetical protein